MKGGETRKKKGLIMATLNAWNTRLSIAKSHGCDIDDGVCSDCALPSDSARYSAIVDDTALYLAQVIIIQVNQYHIDCLLENCTIGIGDLAALYNFLYFRLQDFGYQRHYVNSGIYPTDNSITG